MKRKIICEKCDGLNIKKDEERNKKIEVKFKDISVKIVFTDF